MSVTDDPFGPDWGDVLARTRRYRARRWTLQAVLAAALAVGVASAYAFGHSVVDFGSAAPAGLEQVDEFGQMQVAAPPGMAPGVRPHAARRITTARFDGKRHVLYVAPTASGGYCYLWTGLGGGCRTRHGRIAHAVFTGGLVGPNGLEVLETSFLLAEGTRLVMAFRDGTTADVPFVWVTAPVDAGFALYRVPDAHRIEGTRAVSLALYDAHGQLLTRDPIQGGEPTTGPVVHVRGFSGLMVPRDGIWAKAKMLFDLRGPDGQRVGLWAMPRRGGGTCYLTNTASGCGAPSTSLMTLGFDGDRLCCEVPKRIVRVEARFQDGVRIPLYPRDGYLVWPIPSRHYALGHRLVALVGYDAAGRAVARGRVPRPVDQRGIYPCRRPKSLGYGARQCP